MFIEMTHGSHVMTVEIDRGRGTDNFIDYSLDFIKKISKRYLTEAPDQMWQQ